MLEQLDLDEVAEAYFFVRPSDRPEYERLLIRARGKAVLPILRALLAKIAVGDVHSNKLAHIGSHILPEKEVANVWKQITMEHVQLAYNMIERIEQTKQSAGIPLCEVLLQEGDKMRLAAAILLSMYKSPGKEIQEGVQSALRLITSEKNKQQGTLLRLLEIVLSRTGDVQWRRRVEDQARKNGLDVEQWADRAKKEAYIQLQRN